MSIDGFFANTAYVLAKARISVVAQLKIVETGSKNIPSWQLISGFVKSSPLFLYEPVEA